MSDTVHPYDEPDGPSDLSRFVETGEGFTIVDPGNADQDLPLYDWEAEEPETITQEAPEND